MNPIPSALATSRFEIRVRFCETDLMGIAHHANYLVYFEAGRVDWFRKRGITAASWGGRGLHLPVIETQTRHRASARFDDALVVETTLAEMRSVSMRFTYRITRDDAGAPVLLAEGMTRLAAVDEKHALTRIPNDVASLLSAGEIATGA